MLLITQPRAGRLHNESLALQMAARSLNWETFGAPTSWRLPENFDLTQSGIAYGSQTFCEVIADQMNWEFVQNPFNWLATIPEEFLLRRVNYMLLKDIGTADLTTPKFIKPVDYKVFDAKIYQPGEFIPAESIDEMTPIIVSDPVDFVEEYRCFVDQSSAKTISCYLFHGEINEPKNWNNTNIVHVEEFINKLLAEVKVVPSVIDVGLIKDKGWAVIETNQCWCSGIYGCDPVEVLNVLKLSSNTRTN